VPVTENGDGKDKDGDDYEAEGFKLAVWLAGAWHGIILCVPNVLCDRAQSSRSNPKS
jgi:hypothetical protein